MRYRLICFDAGFTLLEPRRTMAALLGDVLAQQGMAPTEAALRAAWDVADQWFWQAYHRPDNTTWSSNAAIRATWRQYHRLMLQELGIDDPEHALADLVIATHASTAHWQLYADVLPALQALRPTAEKIGIISDWADDLPQLLDALGLTPLVDFVLVSASAGVAKPDPAFYRAALERAGVDAAAAVMIGDSYRADVVGARAAGLDAVLLDRGGTAQSVDAPVIRSLAELAALLA